MSKFEKFMMRCTIVQFFMFLSIMIKVLVVLAMGHGGTKK